MTRVAKCLIRPNAPCGRNLTATEGLCFIAIPSSEEFYPDLQEIMRVLEREGVNGYVANLDQQPGREIFCEKICSKIIEAQLCIVVLNDVLDESSQKRFPNPNVYLEYGLMLGLGKTVLPLQRTGQHLPFDVNHIEVVKYSQRNLAAKLRPLVEKWKIGVQSGGDSKTLVRSIGHRRSPFASRLAKALELKGFREASPASFKLMPTDDIEYALYRDDSGELVYATVYQGDDGLDALLISTRLLLRRVGKAYDAIARAIRVFRQKRWTLLLREWEDALIPLSRFRIVVGAAQGDCNRIREDLTSALLASQVSFPLPQVEVWDKARIEETEKLPPDMRR